MRATARVGLSFVYRPLLGLTFPVVRAILLVEAMGKRISCIEGHHASPYSELDPKQVGLKLFYTSTSSRCISY